jgi:hypothetical protein
MSLEGSNEGDAQFLARFEACDLTAQDFRHREHVRLAYICLKRQPFALALGTMKLGLHRLLAHLGAPASKYHETLTQAWLLAVQHFMHRTGPTTNFEEFLQAGGGQLLDKDIMGSHYSPGRLFSDEARERFVEPDLDPIPRYPA